MAKQMTEERFAYLAMRATLDCGVETLLKGLGRAKRATIGKRQLRTGLRTYLKQSLAHLCRAKTLLAPNVPRYLYDFYVPLDVTAGKESLESPTTKDLRQIGRNILITGLGGCGKSTFLQHLFLQEALAGQSTPVFLRLRNCGDEQSLSGMFLEAIGLKDLTKTQQTSVFKNGGYSFFLDGFDEVTPKAQAAIKKDIIRLSKLSPENTVVVTSRPGENFVSWEGFAEVSPAPLTCDKALELVSKSDFDEDIKARFGERLKEGLFKKHESFLSNPLLLTIMLLVFRDNADIPNKLHLFYEKAFEALYGHHDASKPEGYKRKHHCKLAQDDFSHVLEAFSALTYQDRKHEFSQEEVSTYLDKAKKISSLLFHNVAFLKDLIQSVCILLQDGTGYTYAHRSFQEYFAARFLATQDVDTVKKLLPAFLPRVFFGESMLGLLWEMSPQLVEEALLIPFLEGMRKYLGGPRRITATAHARYLQLLYSTCNWDPDLEHEISATHSEENLEGFSISPASMVNFVCHRYQQAGGPSAERRFEAYAQYMTERFPSGNRGEVPTSELGRGHKLLPILELSSWLSTGEIRGLLSLLDELKQKHAARASSMTKVFGLE